MNNPDTWSSKIDHCGVVWHFPKNERQLFYSYPLYNFEFLLSLATTNTNNLHDYWLSDHKLKELALSFQDII